MSEYVDISGIDKAELLAALYNGSRPLGMGMLHFTPEPMTKDQALDILSQGPFDFDYLKGRVMKVHISEEEGEQNQLRGAWLYDRDNGEGACQRIVDGLREVKP